MEYVLCRVLWSNVLCRVLGSMCDVGCCWVFVMEGVAGVCVKLGRSRGARVHWAGCCGWLQ